MKILITGSTGFIGSYLTSHINLTNKFCRKAGLPEIVELFTVSRRPMWMDSEDNHIHIVQDLEKYPLDWHHGFDLVINCAGYSDPTKYSLDKEIKVAENVAKATFNKMVHLSTVKVYDEDSVYGRGKLVVEDVMKNDKTTIVRLGPVIGPNMRRGIIHDIIGYAIFDEKIELLGKYPGTERPYLHIIDAAKYLMDKRLETVSENRIVDLTNEDLLSSNYVAFLAQKVLKTNKEVVFSGETFDNKNIKPNTTIFTKLGYPIYSSTEAVKRAVNENWSDHHPSST